MDSPAASRSAPSPWSPRRGHEKILILDFGAQYTQLIARRVREAQVYCEIHPADVSDAFVREFGARGHHPFRQPHVGLRGVHRDGARGRCSRPAFRCSASATACRRWRSSSAARSSPARCASSGYARGARARAHEAPRRHRGHPHARRSRAAQRVDEPRRQGDGDAAGLQLMASTAACPIAGMADEARRFYGVQFHPEVTHTLQGKAHPAALRATRSAAARGDWNMPDFISEAIARIREQVGARRGDTGAFRRRRFVGRRRAHTQGDRRAADLRVRRSRPAAAERGRAGAGHLRAAPARQGASTSMPADEIFAALEGRRRPRGEAQDHRQAVRRRVPARSGEDPQREVARAGHDLPGRDRIGGREDEEGDHHQVAPQRRRAARDAASEAPRAAARALQGRGARAGARARAAARHGVPPSVPGPGARACASWAR